MKGDLIPTEQLSPSQGYENANESSNFDCGLGWPKPSWGVEPQRLQPLRNQDRSFFFGPIAQPGLARSAPRWKRENDSERIVLWLPYWCVLSGIFQRTGNPVEITGTRGLRTARNKAEYRGTPRIMSFLSPPPTRSLWVSGQGLQQQWQREGTHC